MSFSELALILFASGLQPSEDAAPEQIRAAINTSRSVDWRACVAQEAGDHPEAYLARMRWAQRAVAVAYPTYVGLAA